MSLSPQLHHRRRHALLRPEVAIPFLLVALIWGSTWLVIKDQLGAAPPSWSVAYRFAIATAGMALLAARQGTGFRMTASGHLFALGIGLSQFFGNFNFVYRAELHLTSGIVAVLFALLMVPNALLGRVFLGVTVTGRFLIGTVIALGGITLLLAHESMAMDPGTSIELGLVFTVLGILAASIANVMQASETARKQPIVLLLAWAMAWGTLFDITLAWSVSGPPVIPVEPRYWAGVAYLGLIGSVVTFPLYFKLIRDLGPGRAAYNGVLVPVVAMALSTVFENYQWSRLAIAGAVLALLGMLVALRGRQID
ncbi:EamA family transporter [Alteraurantiacibacter aestuarii]|uniref:EamA family transporter n=1 Tax=Alteraurantiacibacter aestuarii TaxID=650004 RepID=A0A844ZMZ2_9SPHN|nr:EamA family transporter [Alteraurantiacibacter aestuarii]MXO88682.1 EamA family transporter [Alteraurantiacibacter aestuarii]